jgi:hypothetical protein
MSVPGVEISAAVLYVPEDSELESPPVDTTMAVDWYHTEVTSVLYLRGHEEQLASIFPQPAPASC